MNKLEREASHARWVAHVETWEKSGQTRSAYCRVHGLTVSAFCDWVNRVHRTRDNTIDKPADKRLPRPKTVPVVVRPAPTVSVLPTSGLCLQHPSGWQLQLPADIQAHWLGNVLRQLT